MSLSLFIRKNETRERGPDEGGRPTKRPVSRVVDLARSLLAQGTVTMPLTFSQLTFSTRRGVVPLVLAASAGVAAAMVYCSLEGRRRRRRRRPGRAPLLDPRSKRSKLVLKYFDLPALGEPIKILLILGGFAWEDQKVGHDEWPKLKPSTKWGQVPVLSTDDGFAFSQTKAICRYLAKLVSIDGTHKLYPDAPEVAYEVDELMEAFEDVRSKLMPTLRVADVREKNSTARAPLRRRRRNIGPPHENQRRRRHRRLHDRLDLDPRRRLVLLLPRPPPLRLPRRHIRLRRRPPREPQQGTTERREFATTQALVRSHRLSGQLLPRLPPSGRRG
mmetsp:Transcript_21181/g.68328  ORF Transcript_21181/g.68328 Transcript_21181/m.68328 type:complete len:331 (-) Transcript_21181:1614-2606(-)